MTTVEQESSENNGQESIRPSEPQEKKPQTYRAFAMCSHAAHKDEHGVPSVWKYLSIPITMTPLNDPAIEELAVRLSNAAHDEACPKCPLKPSVKLIIFTGGSNS